MPAVSITSAGSNAKRSKAVSVEEGEDTDTAKLSLKNAQDIRLLRAAVLLTFRFETNSEWIKVYKEANLRYNAAAEQMREQGKQPEEIKQRMGIPCTFAFNEWIKMYIRTLENNKDLQDKANAAVRKWPSWHHIHDHIPVVKRENMHQSKFTRIMIQCPKALGEAASNPDASNWSPTDFFIEMRNLWNAPGSNVVQMRGEAPRGDLERKVQARVDAKENK